MTHWTWVRGARVLLASATLLAMTTIGALAAPRSAASDCTYTFPAAGGLYTEHVTDGDVLCGGPGHDRVLKMYGGTFKGHGGRDKIRQLKDGMFEGGRGKDRIMRIDAGIFRGGPGQDSVTWIAGGTFRGAGGADWVRGMGSGTFDGGIGKDTVLYMFGGTFDGGRGSDGISECVDSPPAVHVEVESVVPLGCDEVP